MGEQTYENSAPQALSDTEDYPFTYCYCHACTGSFADVDCSTHDESDGPGKRSTSCQSDNTINHREAWWKSKSTTCNNTFHR